MVVSTEVNVTFSKLKTALEKAHGFGIKPDRKKMAEIMTLALILTGAAPVATQEELDFYKSARKRVSPTVDGLKSLSEEVDGVAVVVTEVEKISQAVRAELLKKSEAKRMNFFTNGAFHLIADQANADAKVMGNLAKRITDLLFKPEKNGKTNPFKDLAAFAEHRKAVINLYDRLARLGKRHARAITDLTPAALSASDTLGLKVKRAIMKYPSFISVPTGAAIAAAGAYAVPAYAAITYCAGTLVAMVPWIRNLTK